MLSLLGSKVLFRIIGLNMGNGKNEETNAITQ